MYSFADIQCPRSVCELWVCVGVDCVMCYEWVSSVDCQTHTFPRGNGFKYFINAIFGQM